MTDEDLKVIEAMEQYGGSFVKSLAQCFRTADFKNRAILKNAFLDYWNQYTEMAK